MKTNDEDLPTKLRGVPAGCQMHRDLIDRAADELDKLRRLTINADGYSMDPSWDEATQPQLLDAFRFQGCVTSELLRSQRASSDSLMSARAHIENLSRELESHSDERRIVKRKLSIAEARVAELEQHADDVEDSNMQLGERALKAEARVAELESAERKMSSALQGISDMAEDFGAKPCSVPNIVMAENMRKKMVDIYSRLVNMYGDDAEHLGAPYGDGFDAILAGLQGATVIPNEDESMEGEA